MWITRLIPDATIAALHREQGALNAGTPDLVTLATNNVAPLAFTPRSAAISACVCASGQQLAVFRLTFTPQPRTLPPFTSTAP